MRWGLLVLAGLLALGSGAALSFIFGGSEDTGLPPAAPADTVLRRKLSELEHNHQQLLAEYDSFRAASARMDQQLGQSLQEASARTLEVKAAQAEAAAARQEVAQLRASLAEAEETVARLKRELFSQEVSSARAVDEAEADALEQAGPVTVPMPELQERNHCSVLSCSTDGSVVGLGYGRARGAEEGQILHLSRGGQPLGNVVLTLVRSDFSVGLLQTDPHAAPRLQRGEVLHYTLGEQ